MKTLKSISILFRTGMLMAFLIGAVSRAQGQTETVWSGSNITFNNPGNGATDILTASVILTRSSGGGGLYNAASEPGPQGGSPADTQWAMGTLSEFTNGMIPPSNFGDCPLEGGNHPPGFVTDTFVVHLVAENIYLQLTLNSWGGEFGQGAKSVNYTRTTPAAVAPPPTPTVSITNPLNNAVFAAPASEKIGANASVSSGTVTNVQFFTNNVLCGSAITAPFTLTPTLAAGNYAITATATAAGVSATSSVVNISVVTPVTVTMSNAAATFGTNFQFKYPANIGLSYVVQRATNIFQPNWIPLVTNVAASNPVVFVDVHATNSPAFYRVGRLPNP
jgi:hypothetical protein